MSSFYRNQVNRELLAAHSQAFQNAWRRPLLNTYSIFIGVIEVEVEIEGQEAMDDVRENMTVCVVNVRAKNSRKDACMHDVCNNHYCRAAS